MKPDDIDLLADAKIGVNHNVTTSLSAAIVEYDKLEAEKATCDRRSGEIAPLLTSYKTRIFPELLAGYNSSSFTDATTGKKVELELLVAGSLPKEDLAKRKAAIDYVKELGGADLVKTKIIVEFGKGQEARAEALQTALLKKGYNVTAMSDIHAQTLAAFARERIRNGQPMDCEKAGLYSAQIAVPKEVKETVKKVRARK